MLKKLSLSLFLFSFSLIALSCIDGEGLVPPNDLYIPPYSKDHKSKIDEAKFNKIIDDIDSIYKPLMQERHNLDLRIAKRWSDGTVNASAMQMGRTAHVNMFGGLARHHAVTPDGFALVVCHEIGHHIGGLPKVQRLFITMWASNEGQSDYFATSKCMRRYVEQFPIDHSTLEVDPFASEMCSKAFLTKNDIQSCERIAMAGQSLANLFASLRKIQRPRFETPSTNQVMRTDHSHPAAQCRLDTYFQGALCEQDYDVDMSESNTIDGSCTRRQGHDIGFRPRCWFRPGKV